MRHGLRLLPLTLGVFAALAASAHAYVYWTGFGPELMGGGTALGRANLDASGITNTFVGGASSPLGIATDAHYVYWANSSTNSIGRANLDASDANPDFIPNAAAGAAHPAPVDVAVQNGYVYWTDNFRYVGRATVAGTAVTPHFIDFGANSAPNGIAVDATTVYVTASTVKIEQARIDGTGSPSTLYEPLNSNLTWSVAVGGGWVYWGAMTNNDSDGEIGRVQAVGTQTPNESFITNLNWPSGLATDGNELYWADHGTGQIGRAQLTTNGAQNVQTDFITALGNPWGIAFDAAIDPTHTTVTCTPPAIAPGMAVSCTATVSDSASASQPTGTVTFGSGGATYFSPTTCTLVTQPSGGTSCTTGAVSPNAGTISITGQYGGDAVHSASLGTGSFCAGTGTQCGGKPAATKPACIVPKVKGKTLTQARSALKKVHCALGKVTSPAKKRHGHKRLRLVVGSTKPSAGTKLAIDTKVAVKLVAEPPKKRKH